MIGDQWSRIRSSPVSNWPSSLLWATEIHLTSLKATEEWLPSAIYHCCPRQERMRWWEGQIPYLTTCWCKKRNFVSNKISACRLDCISYSKKNNINRTISAIVLLLWQLILPNSSSSNTNNPNILLQITLVNPNIRQFSTTRPLVSDFLRATTTHFQILMWITIPLTTPTRAEQSALRSCLALTQTSQHRETTTCITITSQEHILRWAITKSNSLFRATALLAYNLPQLEVVVLLLSQGWNRTSWRSSHRAAESTQGLVWLKWLGSPWWTTAVPTSLRWTTWISRRPRNRSWRTVQRNVAYCEDTLNIIIFHER